MKQVNKCAYKGRQQAACGLRGQELYESGGGRPGLSVLMLTLLTDVPVHFCGTESRNRSLSRLPALCAIDSDSKKGSFWAVVCNTVWAEVGRHRRSPSGRESAKDE